jgi:colicin import membrane protein
MTSATLPHDALLPQPPGGHVLGAALALGAHAVLVLALMTVMQWRTQTPDVVSAELWASVPEMAAPAPAPAPLQPAPSPVPAPPSPAPAAAEPPPPRVDIATERAERERREARAEAARQKKAEAEKKQREQQAREAAAEQARLDKAREDQLRRMMSQAGDPGAPSGSAGRGTAARDAAPSASYSARLVALIRGNTVFSGEVPGNPAAEVEVRASASGTIISRRLIKSSGHAAWDDAVLRAIDRTGTLPRDTDGRVPSTLIIAFRPKE